LICRYLGPQIERALDRRQRSAELGAGVVGVGDQTAFGHHRTAARIAGLKPNAERAIDLRVGRTLAHVEIVLR